MGKITTIFVVSDSSPIISFARAKKFHIIRKVYGKIIPYGFGTELFCYKNDEGVNLLTLSRDYEMEDEQERAAEKTKNDIRRDLTYKKIEIDFDLI